MQNLQDFYINEFTDEEQELLYLKLTPWSLIKQAEAMQPGTGVGCGVAYLDAFTEMVPPKSRFRF